MMLFFYNVQASGRAAWTRGVDAERGRKEAARCYSFIMSKLREERRGHAERGRKQSRVIANGVLANAHNP